VSLFPEKTRGTMPYFVVELVRAVTLVVLGLVIAFTPGHTATFGLWVFGIFLVVTSISLGGLMLGVPDPAQARGLHWWQALVSLVVGALALALSQAGIVFLLWVIVLWAVLTGASELFAGWRMPVGHSVRRDWMVQGSMTIVLALAVVLQPADSVQVVGFLGAWAVIQGVYATIAGLSGRFALTDDQREGL
jgi:uncharacterized membrane protein HdeD (DUF308 family)